MLWSYTRDQDTLTLELRYDNDSHEYVATTISAGTLIPQTRRFRTAGQFRAWLEAFDRKICRNRMEGQGSAAHFA